MKVRFLAAARAELEDAVSWYNSASAGRGDDFLNAVLDAIETIERKPDLWPYVEPPTRKYLLRAYPFNVLYEVVDEELIIVAIAHHRRRPGYWQARRR